MARILWADDEIELLKPHVLFLEQKGYEVTTVNNGVDAVDLTKEQHFDVVFLDENMPGISGLEALDQIKGIRPNVPVIMITKSEEEYIMEEAIGSKIADYLIKPVNPNQILLSLKKNLDTAAIVNQQTSSKYQQEFRTLGMRLNDRLDTEEWKEVYERLVYWELEIAKASESGMDEILDMQKKEANQQFCKFIENNYLEWINGTSDDTPQMSHTLIKDKVAPILDENPAFLLVIDNLRFDQWKVIQPLISKYYTVEDESIFYSILPTATHYARNAIFAGLMPSEIEKKYPKLWLNEDQEGGKNMHEKELLEHNLKRLGKNYKFSYNKITNLNAGKKLVDNFANLLTNHLNVIVYNFVDMLSHARTDMEVIRELADDEKAYRSLTLSWFEHSPLLEIIKKVHEKGLDLIITTDHGTIKVDVPSKIVGNKNTNSNLRYKTGRNLDYKSKDVFAVKDPKEAFLPSVIMSSEFVFAKENSYFVYPNNYNYYVNFYKDTFQHGGVSLEECLIPFIHLKAKK
jgi:CheY-like chemotaxis protein